MKINKAHAVWKGNLINGNGMMDMLQGGVSFPFSFKTRFKDEKGANPEMLIGAAHAGCFSMAFSNMLSEAGYEPKEVSTTAEVKLEPAEGGFAITGSHLIVQANVPGINEEMFQTIAKKAKEGCPVSRALASINISMEAKLVS